MKDFIVKIATPDGEKFSGEAKSILVKSINGDLQIMKAHADLIAPLATGRAKLVLTDGTERAAAASGGFIIVKDGEAKVIATTFEFADEIDLNRAKRAKENAETKIANSNDGKEIELAKAKLARALTRISVARN